MFGADPEVFATYESGGKEFVLPPAYFRKFLNLKFKPDDRHPEFLFENGIKIHEDGAAFEFTLPPADSISELLKTVHKGYALLQDRILSAFPEYKIRIVPTINYEVDRWLKYQEDVEFFNSFMFGCDPHMLAWEPEKEDEAVDASTHPFRYGGGHIHFSGNPIFEENPILCARTFDMTVGLAATAFSPFVKLEKLRTFRYGQAGVWRPQRYPNGNVGLEYRSISNSWTNPDNKSLAEEIEKWSSIAIQFLSDPDKAEAIIKKVAKPLLIAIKTSNQVLAKKLLVAVEGEI